MHHHAVKDYARAVQADRVAAAAPRWPRGGTEDLDRLVATAAAGDERAWQTLVTRFGPRLLRLARSQGLNRQEAEDAVQETWVRLLRNIARVREPAALGGWLATTARHESLRVRERARREEPTADELRAEGAVSDVVEQQLDASECRVAVTRALQALPVRHRRLMVALFADAGGSYHDIAAELEMPVGSIGPIRGRCLAQLRRDGRLRRLAEQLD
jgi:RNA polymerase sigma factor (sigma-70 family)